MERKTEFGNFISYLKIILFGDSEIGKTCLVKRLSEFEFFFEYEPTQNIQAKLLSFKIGDKNYPLKIYELGSNDSYESLYEDISLHTDAFICMFDVGKLSSFKFIKEKLKYISNFYATSNIILVANKTDLPNREVPKEMSLELAENLQCKYLEISVKDNYNISELISSVTLLEKLNIKPIYSEKVVQYLSKKDIIKCTSVYKVILLGDSTVGKSSFYNRFFNDSFNENFLSTMGVNENSKIVSLNGEMIKFQLWDTAGQEHFRSVTTSYYKNADGVILLYDVTNKKSFESVSVWMKDINSHAKQNVTIFILANKIDLKDSRIITKDIGRQLINKFPYVNFYETSVKYDINASEVVMYMTEEISKKRGNKPEGESLGKALPKKKCCEN